MPQEYDSEGRVIAPERPTGEPSGSPAEKEMTHQTKILTEIRDMLCEIIDKTPPTEYVSAGPVTGKPKKKPGRPRKTHEHEVG